MAILKGFLYFKRFEIRMREKDVSFSPKKMLKHIFSPSSLNQTVWVSWNKCGSMFC